MIRRCPECGQILAIEGEAVPVACQRCGAKVLPGKPGSRTGAAPGDGFEEAATVVGQPSDGAGEGSGGSDGKPQQPRQFGRYVILQEMGRGAMGIVYKAMEPTLKRVVALKVLLAGEHASDDEIRRFMREAQAIARVRHPNIVPVHDVGITDGKHYFTMEFIEGKGLDEVVKSGGLAPAQSLDIIEKIADALAEAHRAGVIHRDLKPSNVMLDSRGEVRIMDFGLAKPMDAETKYTRSGTTIGTPSYMPPEQARGDLGAIDARSDVYAIGAVAYELFTGRAPFEGHSMLDIIMDVLNNEPDPPRKVNPRIHRDIQTIILKCLEKDPARRYASAEDLRDDIRRYKSGEAIRARPAGILRRALARVARRRMEVASVLALGVVAAVSAWFVRGYSQRLEEIESSKIRPTWREMFSDPAPGGDKSTGWTKRISYIDLVGGKVGAVLNGVELRSTEIYFSHVEVTVDAAVAEGARSASASLGLVGRDGAPFFVTYGGGKLVLLGLDNVEQTFARNRGLADLAAIAERDAPPMSPGCRYKLDLREEDATIRFSITGPGVSETLEYRNIHLSNWRMKNLQPTLRSVPGELTYRNFALKQLIPGEQDSLASADQLLYRGEYNGAQSAYMAIVDSGREPAKAVAALHRLGLACEIKQDYDKAVEYYDRAAAALGAKAPPLCDEENMMLGECRLRSILCELAGGRLNEAESRLASMLARPDPMPACLIWEVPALVDAFAAAGRLDGAISAASAASLPQGFSRMQASIGRLGLALVAAGRPVDVAMLGATYPGPHLVPATVQAVAKLTETGNLKGALSMLKGAAAAYPDATPTLRTGAEPLLGKLVVAGLYAEVVTAHKLLGGDAAAAAVQAAIGAATAKGEYADAQKLLQYAYGAALPKDALSRAAAALAGALVASGRPAAVIDLQKACPAADLGPQLLAAAEALSEHGTFGDCMRALALGGDLSAGKGHEFTALAARIGARYTTVDSERAHWKALAAFTACPGPEHLPNLRALVLALAAAGEYEDALSAYALARGRMPSLGGELDVMALDCLEQMPPGERRRAAMDSLGSVTQALADRLEEQALWLVALGDLYCRFGSQAEAARAYEAAAANAQDTPRRGAALGLFRLGVLAEVSGDSARAAARWLDVLECKASDERLLAAGRFMLGRADTQALSAAGAAEGGAELGASCAELLQALAIRGSDEPGELTRRGHIEASRELAMKSRTWPYHVFASGALSP